jgi:phosphoribosylcarboxyaminoimidazole (NCAIR) mutase
MGAANAGHLAAQILAGSDAALRRTLAKRRAEMAAGVMAKSKGLGKKLAELLKR